MFGREEEEKGKEERGGEKKFLTLLCKFLFFQIISFLTGKSKPIFYHVY